MKPRPLINKQSLGLRLQQVEDLGLVLAQQFQQLRRDLARGCDPEPAPPCGVKRNPWRRVSLIKIWASSFTSENGFSLLGHRLRGRYCDSSPRMLASARFRRRSP